MVCRCIQTSIAVQLQRRRRRTSTGHFLIKGERNRTGKSRIYTTVYACCWGFSSIVLFCPRSDKANVLMMKSLIYTHTRRGRAMFSCWTAEWSSVVTSAALCIFLHTEAEGYSTTGRPEVRGRLLLVPQPLPPSLISQSLSFSQCEFAWLFVKKQNILILSVKRRTCYITWMNYTHGHFIRYLGY